jgi:hypothetical protein
LHAAIILRHDQRGRKKHQNRPGATPPHTDRPAALQKSKKKSRPGMDPGGF